MIRINEHTFLFSFYLKYKDFEGSTNVLGYIGKKFIFICDSFISPEKMLNIKKFLQNKFPDKKFLLFNSHSDFDHFWGNSAFKNDIILSSIAAKNNMLNNNFSEEQKYFELPDLIYPNLCFERKVNFTQEDVIFFISPGHTNGSASCYLIKDRILFAGDNLEYPHPFFEKKYLKEHIKSIKNYIKLNPKIIVPGHGEIAYNQEILYDNLNFLKRFVK